MDKIKMAIIVLMSLPKTLYLNLRCLNFTTAIRMPVFISYKIRINGLNRSSIKIEGTVKPFRFIIGLGGSRVISRKKGSISLNGSEIVLKGRARLSEGCTIVSNGGKIIFGDNFRANTNFFISCDNKIMIGKNVAAGWDVTMRDSDGHYVVENGKRKDDKGEIRIGDHCWICANVTILKNNRIGNDNIIAYNSCLTGMKECKDNCLIGGYPAKIIKTNVNWQE